MMPRPTLISLFALTYRKIPVLAIGRDVYCDTSLIIEALEHHPSFQPPQHATVYPKFADGCTNRALIRLFESYHTDRPWFRIMTGLVPGAVWRTSFGKDRGGLIGHPLDAARLEKKIPRNLAGLELHLSILEEQMQGTSDDLPWLFSTKEPSLADISLYFMFKWGRDISRGIGVKDLTGGESEDLDLEGMDGVFNEQRFPGMWRWFHHFKLYFEQLPKIEERKIEINEEQGVDEVVENLRAWKGEEKVPMVPTPTAWNKQLDAKIGLRPGAKVYVAPGDTGFNDPVAGELVSASAEEVVIKPVQLGDHGPRLHGVRVHFPRLEFVVRPLDDVGISNL